MKTAKPKKKCEAGKWQVLKHRSWPYPRFKQSDDGLQCDLCQRVIKWKEEPFWRCECPNHGAGQYDVSDLDICITCGTRDKEEEPLDVVYTLFYGEKRDSYYLDSEEEDEKEKALTPL